MEKVLLLLATILIAVTSVFAQTPQQFKYQAVLRDAGGNIIANQSKTVDIDILMTSPSGEVIFSEEHNVTTTAQGLINLNIGSIMDMSGIDWSADAYFIRISVDGTVMGTSQLLSVPYALNAKNAENYDESDPLFVASPANGILSGDITNWNTAYGWGNHATAGYLTSYTETDPRVPTGTQIGEMQYWNGSVWVTVPSGIEGQILTFSDGVPTWRSAAITIAGLTDAYNPYTNKVWMDRNLGASQVATSSTDAAAYGDLYQWGRGTDGHQIRTSGTTTSPSSSDTPGHGNFISAPNNPYDWRSPQNVNLWQGVNGINNPCPSGYRIPTNAEWDAERLSWSSNNADGAFASPLKLPEAGYRNFGYGSLVNVGSLGYYWSSTVDGFSSRYLGYNSSSAGMYADSRANGLSVRCLKD